MKMRMPSLVFAAPGTVEGPPATHGELALVLGEKLYGLRDLLRAGLGDAA